MPFPGDCGQKKGAEDLGMQGLWRLAVCAVLAMFILLPLALSLMLGFIASLPRADLPEGSATLANQAGIFGSPTCRAAILNSTLQVVLNVALCLPAGRPAAYALPRYGFTGDRHILILPLVFRVTRPVVQSLPIFIHFAQFGLVNSRVGIALVECLFKLPVAI
jgi:glycerol transport system permease protein